MEWTWLGDHFALDVANTVRLRRGRYAEQLESPGDFATWAALQSDRLLAPLPAPISEDQLARFLVLRDHLIAIGRAIVAGETPPRESIDALNAAVSTLPLVSGMAADGRTPLVLLPPSADAVDVLIAQAAASTIELLTGSRRDTLALCPAPSCGQFFLEARPNQQWCCTTCGNRARVARHAAR